MSGWHEEHGYRIGLDPPKGFRQSCGFIMLSAPNRYRKILKNADWAPDCQAQIVELMRREFPEKVNPVGIDIDPVTWDQVLIWLPISADGFREERYRK